MKNLLLAAVVALALCACGGGGGGGLQMSMPQTPLKASIFQSQLPYALGARATVTSETSAETIYVEIADVAGTFVPGPG